MNTRLSGAALNGLLVMNNTKTSLDHLLEKVYIEASQWVRLANQVIWGVGTLFVPASVAAIWFALTTKANRPLLAMASLFLFGFWMAICHIYAGLSRIARNALMTIEKIWDLQPELRWYTEQHNLLSRPWNVIRLQKVMLVLLVITWIVIIFS